MPKKRVGTVLLAAIAMAVIRITVIICNMEMNDSVYYLRGDFKTGSFVVMTFVLLLCLAALAFFVGRGKKVVHNSGNSTVSVISCTLAFVFFGTVIIYFASKILSGAVLGFDMGMAVAILSLLSAVVFLLSGLKQFNREVLAVFSLFPLFLTALRMLYDFMNTDAAPLANSGGYHIVGLVALLLYFLFEGKSFLGKGSAMLYYFSGYTSVLFLMVYAVPNLFLHCMGMIQFDYSASLSVADVVTAVYICSRMRATEAVSE